MYQCLMICIFILIGLTVNAQTINLRGKVTNLAGQAIANAVVTLVKQGLQDTTGTDGAYSITKNTAVVVPLLVPRNEDIFLDRGVLEFSLPHPSSVKVEVFDIKGNLLKKESLQNAATGFYRFTIAGNSCAANLLVIKASIGQRAVTFRYLPLYTGTYRVSLPDESGTLAQSKLTKLSAVNDTLKTTAAHYLAKAMAIISYDQELNIALDTAGGGGHTAGCGKTPGLQKSTPPPNTKMNYNYVTVAGAKRQYLLWYPDNYDNTQPYRLVICYHWWSGSASQVFDCKTEGIPCYTTQSPFYGLMNLANNSAIFIAPDGIDAGWANTNSRDLVFTDSILQQVENNFCIDTARIFACGFSYGGGMSYAIACDRAKVFRAVGVFAGAQLSGCKDGSIPIAYYASHGQDDGTCNISGGRSLRDHFVQVDSCTPQNPPGPADGSGSHICTTYSGCSEGHPVRWCEFDGSNGHDPSPKDRGQDTTWNPGEVWRFFSQF